jgi:hypothetical protein
MKNILDKKVYAQSVGVILNSKKWKLTTSPLGARVARPTPKPAKCSARIAIEKRAMCRWWIS